MADAGRCSLPSSTILDEGMEFVVLVNHMKHESILWPIMAIACTSHSHSQTIVILRWCCLSKGSWRDGWRTGLIVYVCLVSFDFRESSSKCWPCCNHLGEVCLCGRPTSSLKSPSNLLSQSDLEGKPAHKSCMKTGMSPTLYYHERGQSVTSVYPLEILI